MKNLRINQKGFTLIEVLLVVAVIAILAGIVILAINPSRQLGQSKDAQRKADVNTILNAVYQYALDNNGSLPSTITTSSTQICNTGIADATCDGASLIKLTVLTASEKYIVSIPKDPTGATTNGSGYNILKTANGRVTVSAPSAEQSTVSVTR